MNISIVGTGYVGLVTGACFADRGHVVTCVDIDHGKIDSINRGVPPIHEEGLEALLKAHVGTRLSATSDLASAVLGSDVTLVAAPTPFDGTQIDLKYIREVAAQIGAVLERKPSYHAVVVKSTVVPGTTDEVVLPILEAASGKRGGADFGVGMNPEFLSEGVAVEDFMRPDRIVLGGMDDRTIGLQQQLYAGFDAPRIATNNKTAEMIKYASNSLLATAISFSNELGNLCSALGGVDVVDVMRGVHASRYLTPQLPDGTRVRAPIASFFEAGCGFGGSCLPKDVSALVAHGQKRGVGMELLRSVLTINARQPEQIAAILEKHFGGAGALDGLPVAVLGLAFKPGTDDLRESPAVPIINDLLAHGCTIRTYDPAAMRKAHKLFAGRADVVFAETMDAAVAAARAVVIVTKWDEFKRLPEVVAKLDPQPLVVDGRRMLDRGSVQKYAGIGI